MPVERLTCEHRCRQEVGTPFRESLHLVEDACGEVYARLLHIPETLQERKSTELVVGKRNNQRFGRLCPSLASFAFRTVEAGVERRHTIDPRIDPFAVQHLYGLRIGYGDNRDTGLHHGGQFPDHGFAAIGRHEADGATVLKDTAQHGQHPRYEIVLAEEQLQEVTQVL